MSKFDGESATLKFSVTVFWGLRQDTPAQIAERLVEALKRLSAIHPAFSNWHYVLSFERPSPLNPRLEAVEARIASFVSKKDNGSPCRQWGYWWSLRNTSSDNFGPRYVSLGGRCGITNHVLNNAVSLSMDPFSCLDSDLVTFDVFREALFALAETFDAVVGRALPASLMDLWPKGPQRPLELAWISYLAHPFASVIARPAGVEVAYRPNGGVLMAATPEIFVTENPSHLAAARAIEAAVAPFNTMPWPANPLRRG